MLGFVVWGVLVNWLQLRQLLIVFCNISLFSYSPFFNVKVEKVKLVLDAI